VSEGVNKIWHSMNLAVHRCRIMGQPKELVYVTQQSVVDLAANAVGNDAHTAIENDRQEIDALDSKIIGLIQSRHRVSFRIQERRRGDGGPRTVLAREMVVIDRYRQALGPEGAALVTAILRLCRGPAPESAVPAASDRGEPTT